MNFSVIIPAYNEEKYLPGTLEALRGDGFELIVVDNQSTDSTRQIAIDRGARIVDEGEHNIGRVRNTGASAASGDVLIFIDADTRVRPGVFEAIERAMEDKRCIGGSVAVEYEPFQRRPWAARYLGLAQYIGTWLKWRQGALQFCRKEIFDELGGYDETIYVGEDIEFHWRLDKLAKARDAYTAFIEHPKVITSNRRFERMGLIRTIVITHPVTIFLAWRIRSVWKDWYEEAIR